MKFCVIRHPEAGLGTCAETALEHHRAKGWSRVSDWRAEASDFHLAEYADAFDDLDPAPAQEPEAPAEQAAEAAADELTDSQPARGKNKEKQA